MDHIVWGKGHKRRVPVREDELDRARFERSRVRRKPVVTLAKVALPPVHPEDKDGD